MSLFSDGHTLVLFAVSILLFLAGHIFRAARLTALYPETRAVQRFDLLLGLAIGYSINTFVPARVGELVRMLYVGKRCRIRYAYVGATIAAERLSDAVFLGLLCLVLLAAHRLPPSMLALILAVLAASALGVLFGYLIKRSLKVRHGIWKLASVFNVSIAYSLLDLVWSFSEIITGRLMLRVRFLRWTAVMWLFYGLSYFTFGRAIGEHMQAVVYQMLGTPLHSMAQRVLRGQLSPGEFLVLAYGFAPVLIILIYGAIRESSSFGRILTSLLRGRFNTWDVSPSPVSEHFKEHSEYEYFLSSLFIDEDRRVSGFGVSAIEDGVVHRLFQGGSGAITALVAVSDELMIRKFAIGDMKDKLKLQVDWLRLHQAELPLVEVLQERMETSFYRYDMPYSAQASDFYDVIHTAPIDQTRRILTEVVTTMHDFHQATRTQDAPEPVIEQYLRQKVTQNATAALDMMRDLIGGEDYILNWRKYSLRDWDRLMDPAWLRRQVRDRRTSGIHGDLTIENIIVSSAHPRGWYIIDPNPGNLFESPFIDWAKLRQSLHLGYEGLNKAPLCVWKGSELSLTLTRSHAYDQLDTVYNHLLESKMGPDAHREVAFHELVNYLRLLPYKIRQSQSKSLTFFACTSILLAEYLEKYD